MYETWECFKNATRFDAEYYVDFTGKSGYIIVYSKNGNKYSYGAMFNSEDEVWAYIEDIKDYLGKN